MLRFGRLQYEVGPREYITWTEGSLRSFLNGYFDTSPELSCDQIRLPKSFDAWSLENVAGIKVSFTDNLVDHLRLVDDDGKVMIFHHASFLERQRSSSE